jgi:hypothetical protein
MKGRKVKARHYNEEGRPANDRGKAPHKGGYHGAKKGINPKKVWFEVLINNNIMSPKVMKVASSWKPGRTKNKYKKTRIATK